MHGRGGCGCCGCGCCGRGCGGRGCCGRGSTRTGSRGRLAAARAVSSRGNSGGHARCSRGGCETGAAPAAWGCWSGETETAPAGAECIELGRIGHAGVVRVSREDRERAWGAMRGWSGFHGRCESGPGAPCGGGPGFTRMPSADAWRYPGALGRPECRDEPCESSECEQRRANQEGRGGRETSHEESACRVSDGR